MFFHMHWSWFGWTEPEPPEPVQFARTGAAGTFYSSRRRSPAPLIFPNMLSRWHLTIRSRSRSRSKSRDSSPEPEPEPSQIWTAPLFASLVNGHATGNSLYCKNAFCNRRTRIPYDHLKLFNFISLSSKATRKQNPVMVVLSHTYKLGTNILSKNKKQYIPNPNTLNPRPDGVCKLHVLIGGGPKDPPPYLQK